ncbi:MAG TPA: tetratricopeptide repeat protein [Pyrinomonadaceae bacterium]|nr:tetratricopeptide repeat protein [Pyrinomonadaceae bacterium]
MQDREEQLALAKQATDNIKTAIQVYKLNRPTAHYFLGTALILQSRYQEAESEFNLYFARIKELEDRLTSVAAICNSHSSGFKHLKAMGYFSLGMMHLSESLRESDSQRKTELLNKAIDQFKRTYGAEQAFTAAYFELGFIYSMQGNYEEAINQYKKATDYQTDRSRKAGTYATIAETYIHWHHYEEAIDYINRARESDPSYVGVYALLGRVHFLQKHYVEAINDLQEALRRETSNAAKAQTIKFLASAYTGFGSALLSQGNYSEAINEFQKALLYETVNSTKAQILRMLGFSYYGLKQYQEAVESFNKAIELFTEVGRPDPIWAATYIDLANVYITQGMYDEAIIPAKKAIDLGVEDSLQAYTVLGASYWNKYTKTHDRTYLDESINWLKKAIQVNPNSPLPYSYLGLAYVEAKNKDAALEQHQQLVRLNSPLAEELMKKINQMR